MKGDRLPDEVIIIDTSTNEEYEIINSICSRYKLIKIIKAIGAYPGQARNIGICNSVGDILGFIDTRTVPPLKWLSSQYELIEKNNNISGVYGNTEYHTSNEISRLIKYSTYGVNPLRTVPGMVIKRTAIARVGDFIPTTRAGEDTDWLMRLHLQKIQMSNPRCSVIYYGLDQAGFGRLLIKWIRNYMHSSNLPYLNAHKSIYYHVLVLLLLISAFNWNSLVAGWNMESEFYAPHITKLIILINIGVYAIIRGVIFPFKKGVEIRTLMPYRWILIAFLSFLFDLAKLVGFLIGSLLRKINLKFNIKYKQRP